MSNVRIFTRINKSRQVTPSLPLSSEEQLPVINPNPTGQAIRHNSTLDKNGGDSDNDYYGHNTEDIQDALEGSNLPSAINVFATIDDIDLIPINIDFTASTGNPKFDIPRKYGFTTAETGNITFDGTDAKESVMIKIRHNSGTAPTFSGPGGVTLRREGGTYTLSVDNIIYVVCHKNDAGTLTFISYTITKAL